MQHGVYDVALYTMNDYAINLLLLSYYVCKNFLQEDSHMTNDHGTTALVGVSGSGKSNFL